LFVTFQRLIFAASKKNRPILTFRSFFPFTSKKHSCVSKGNLSKLSAQVNLTRCTAEYWKRKSGSRVTVNTSLVRTDEIVSNSSIF